MSVAQIQGPAVPLRTQLFWEEFWQRYRLEGDAGGSRAHTDVPEERGDFWPLGCREDGTREGDKAPLEEVTVTIGAEAGRKEEEAARFSM
jgi:hypothetical protein